MGRGWIPEETHRGEDTTDGYGGSATAATTSKTGGGWKRAGEGGKRLGDGLGDSQPRFADAKVEQTQTAISRDTTID